jgi:hypothetical protein
VYGAPDEEVRGSIGLGEFRAMQKAGAFYGLTQAEAADGLA